jgi:long-chain acyl-CoA synthetase
MAYNDQCRFTSALVTINEAELKLAVKKYNLSADSAADLDRIIDLVLEDLRAFERSTEYSGIPAQWRPASFAIIPGIFDENNGLVNSTMKLVRHNVSSFYRSKIDEMYANGTPNPKLPGNHEALKTILK